MLTKKDLETLAETRLGDARHLLSAGRCSAAYYLAGYAVELGIKVCIAAASMISAVGDPNHGVLQWLKKRW